MPKNGENLSVLGFGCMRLPGQNELIDEKRATRQIRYAIDHGVNYLDTAMPYHKGESELFLGRALADGYRGRVKLATKLPPWRVETRADMDHLLKSQLDRLRTDRIDYYLIHGMNRNIWEKMKSLEVLEFLDKAKQDGRIGCAGYSFHGDKDVFKEIVDAYDWDFCQIQYNYLDENNQAGTEGLKYAASMRMGVIVMEPLLGGNLSMRVPSEVKAIFEQASIKRSPAEWALRWVWNHPEVTVVLSGMNREEDIEENLRIADEAIPNSLTKVELEIIDHVKKIYRKLMKAACTGCRYCMPCPNGVEIPFCFETYNTFSMFGDKIGAQIKYILRTGGNSPEDAAYASLCQECGECEELCPQNLPIRELLKDVAREFEDSGFRPLLSIIRNFLAGNAQAKKNHENGDLHKRNAEG